MKVKEVLKNCSTWIPNKKYNNIYPRVSVILVISEESKRKYIDKAIKSVLNQEFTNIELIIVDDYSNNDDTYILEKYIEIDDRVSIIKHSYNVGLKAICEYEGYMRARGEYITFIFDDEEWYKNALNSMLEYIEENDLKAAYGVYTTKVSDNSNKLMRSGKKIQGIENIRSYNFIANGSILLHRSVIEKVGLYDPHIILEKSFDWDFLQRICGNFRFEATDNLIGVKRGVISNITKQINTWVVNERMSINRNQLLSPQNYGECDIFDLHVNATKLYQDTLLSNMKKYKEKKWIGNFEKYIEKLGNINFDKRKKNILYITFYIDASTILAFDRLEKHNDYFNIRIITSRLDVKKEILNADMVIFARSINDYNEYIEFARYLNVPCYYYIDDNYHELAQQYDNKYLKNLAYQTNSKNLKRFAGIFCSSKPLMEYFRKRNLHDNLLLIEPIIDKYNISESNALTEREYINIAFLGGDFRGDIFNDIFMPALNKLSFHIKVNLIVPNTFDIEEIRNVNVVYIERSADLDLVLKRFCDREIDIQVHISPNIKNNKYKTVNALINATQMGANLVTSDYEPYNTLNNINDMAVLCSNTIEDWYEKLLFLCENREERIRLYKNAKRFCIENFSDLKASNALKEILDKQSNVDNNFLVNKLENLYSLYLERNIQIGNILSSIGGNPILASREVECDILSFSKAILKKKKYNIKFTINEVSKIGILFTSETAKPAGNVTMKIYYKSKLLRESKLDIKNIIFNHWSYFKFDKISDYDGKILTIELIFNYKTKDEYIGVYEDRRRRTFIYKVFNKLHVNLKGLDVLYVDCKS